VARAERDRANPADVWLPEGAKSQSPEKQNGDAGAHEWLLDEPRSPFRKKAKEPAAPPRRERATAEPASAEPGEQPTATDVSDSRLKEAEEALAEQRIRIAELETRLEEREAEFKQTLEQREAEYAEALRERSEALREQTLDAQGVQERGKLDVNDATFEQFRDLGLSVTQSARLIAHRDARGGFDSLDELDEVPGIPAALKRTLRDQLELG
jgi:DNA uptake protein ComE-like DNA-binding protein